MTIQRPDSDALDPGTYADDSTSQRILAATARVLIRRGMSKLSLSDVALEAEVSRPTLYRWFASKQDLLDAYVGWERSLYERAIADAVVDLPTEERLDAALRVIAAGQHSYPGLRMVDVEPTLVIQRLAGVLPRMRAGIERLLPGPDSPEAAATIIRVAISHYLVPSDDADDFLTQLRHAARLTRPIENSRAEPPAILG